MRVHSPPDKSTKALTFEHLARTIPAEGSPSLKSTKKASHLLRTHTIDMIIYILQRSTNATCRAIVCMRTSTYYAIYTAIVCTGPACLLCISMQCIPIHVLDAMHVHMQGCKWECVTCTCRSSNVQVAGLQK